MNYLSLLTPSGNQKLLSKTCFVMVRNNTSPVITRGTQLWPNVCRNMTLYMTLFEKVYKVQFIEFLLQHDYIRIWNISLNCSVENSFPSTAVFSAAKNFSRPHNLSQSIVVIEKTWRELCFHVCSWLCR